MDTGTHLKLVNAHANLQECLLRIEKTLGEVSNQQDPGQRLAAQDQLDQLRESRDELVAVSMLVVLRLLRDA